MWTKPEQQISLITQYSGVLTPDFSMYLEMPYALQLYNTFRNRWCGAYFASKGMRVIPTVSWADEHSFDFCFKGIPKGSVVAVSTYMFHEHNHHADQKAVFMKGYNRMMQDIEPSKIICYSEPFTEMTGDIVYIDYELNSWRHLNDDIPEKSPVKYFVGMILPVPDMIYKSYTIKGGGSAYGGEWKPKKEADKKFLGEPNSTRIVHISTSKGGYKAEIKYNEKGQAVRERHYTDHGRPDQHSNPHDHPYSWENGYPQRGGVINYPGGNVPDINKQRRSKIMSNDILVIPYNPEENRFETLGEFKRYIDEGWELSFIYNGVEYGIDKMDDGLFYLSNCDTHLGISGGIVLEQLLDWEIDGVKIRDFITTDDAEISDRPGPI